MSNVWPRPLIRRMLAIRFARGEWLLPQDFDPYSSFRCAANRLAIDNQPAYEHWQRWFGDPQFPPLCGCGLSYCEMSECFADVWQCHCILTGESECQRGEWMMIAYRLIHEPLQPPELPELWRE